MCAFAQRCLARAKNRHDRASVTVFEGNRPLLLAFRRGEREALARVYWHYVERVERALRRGFLAGDVRVPGLTDDDAVAELIQETFARAFSPAARERFDGIRRYEPYLLRIARNLMVDRARLNHRVKPSDDLEDCPELADEIEEDLSRRAEADAAKAYLRTLNEESQHFVELRYQEDLSQEEIASRMKITRRRVRTLEGRIRRGLEAHLNQTFSASDRPKRGGRP